MAQGNRAGHAVRGVYVSLENKLIIGRLGRDVELATIPTEGAL